MFKRVVSVDVLRRVFMALDKHFPFEDFSITARKDDKGRTIVLVCWRVIVMRKPNKTIVFSVRSRPLFCIPFWAYLGILYRFEKAKRLLKDAEETA